MPKIPVSKLEPGMKLAKPVTTKNGMVTLGGKASNAAELNLATKLTKDVNGVKSVKNQMAIK